MRLALLQVLFLMLEIMELNYMMVQNQVMAQLLPLEIIQEYFQIQIIINYIFQKMAQLLQVEILHQEHQVQMRLFLQIQVKLILFVLVMEHRHQEKLLTQSILVVLLVVLHQVIKILMAMVILNTRHKDIMHSTQKTQRSLDNGLYNYR